MAVSVFDTHDDPYLQWMDENPEGYVVNTARGRNSTYFTLHRSGCRTITNYITGQEKDGYTARDYIKVCSNDAQEILDWAKKNRPKVSGFESICTKCKPNPPTIASVENEGIREEIKNEREGALGSATYLLTWKPERSPWRTLEEDVEHVSTNGTLQVRWSCGNTKKIEPGDRVFLLCQGSGPRGIIGSGTVVAAPYEEEHWNEDRARQGDTALYVDVRLDTLVNPFEEELFERERLDRPPFDKMHWDVQASGTTIPPEVAQALEEAWSKWLSQRGEVTGGRSEEKEVRAGRTYPEGRPQQVNTTRYERNKKAREECLNHYGYRCQVCDIKLTERYGPSAERLIHVHHRKSVAEIGEEYEVDPKEDLIPVCPNCHAVIHQRRTPYRIEEVRAMLKDHSWREDGVEQQG